MAFVCLLPIFLFIVQFTASLTLSNQSMSPKANFHITKKAVKLVQSELQKSSNTAKAVEMQGYVRSEMPMYGVMKKNRTTTEKILYGILKEECNPLTLPLYRDLVETLWNLPHREEKYLAIEMAIHHKKCIVMDNLPLYERMLREDFMWWDLVDPIAVNLIGPLTKDHRDTMEPILQNWIRDEDCMWIRRAAILAQLKHKQETNQELLFHFCWQRMHEKEFFIRKAIGWSLREYSKTHPEAVREYLIEHKDRLPGLSYREASRILVKKGKTK
jgi:3-methyladenine DNA glycosylase AlkD